ncbi:DUF2188 domain-containing protein [Pseudovibrio sp. JE062]|uniref:DUF2188 domain-containing protein n=1 Tax=Pseudovibrio sp. JE062 TaxID=439495 RepID=UPI000186B7F3|nr:DUF2188 domain-containing protein [Pseudovibrio sp. JE062]EEA95057.1 conserved hypothetical protein [Pseudovibrio sp. JE062]
MSEFRKFFLTKDKNKGDWVLEQEGSGRARRRFSTKAEATAGGVLEGALGSAGGSVRIRKENGQIQEERTFPRAKDPEKSPG